MSGLSKIIEIPHVEAFIYGYKVDSGQESGDTFTLHHILLKKPIHYIQRQKGWFVLIIAVSALTFDNLNF